MSMLGNRFDGPMRGLFGQRPNYTPPLMSVPPNTSQRTTQPVAVQGQSPAPQAPNPQQAAAPGGSLSNILASLGVSNVSPLQPTYLNNPPIVNPATLGGNFLSQFSPDQSISQILNYAMPLFQKSQTGLNDQLAAMGMEGGPALNAQSALSQNLMSALGPMLSQAVQQSQGNMLNAGEFNANALNQGNYFNAQNIIGANQYNTGAYNNAQNNLWNALMQGWSAPFNAYQGINLAGLSGAQSLAGMGLSNAGQLGNSIASTFPVNTSNPFGGLGSALGGLFAQAPQPSQPAQPPPATPPSGVENLVWT